MPTHSTSPARPTVAAAAHTTTFQPFLAATVMRDDLRLATLRHLTVDALAATAPTVNAAPTGAGRAVAGPDGTYFVPQARLASWSPTSGAPYLYLDLQDGEYRLHARFQLVRDGSVAADAEALPVDGITASLVGSDGTRVDFSRCDELPPTDQPEGVVSILDCETVVDHNQVLGLLREDRGAKFVVQGTVHYVVKTAAGAPMVATFKFVNSAVASAATAVARFTPPAKPQPRDHRRKPGRKVPRRPKAKRTAKRKPRTGAKKTGTQSTRLSLAGSDDLGAYFPADVPENQRIYARVTTGSGSAPWAEWVATAHGRYKDGPLPEHYFVLPDEYRLAFDVESGMPAMIVILVPPQERTDRGGNVTISDYRIRCRFSVLPWLDPARVEALRDEISRVSGVGSPRLLVGGIESSSCALSKTYDSLGSSVVGTVGDGLAVDPLGFDLVLDCTSEFYSLVSRLLVSEGVAGEVVNQLAGSEESNPSATVPVRLRLDRPVLDFLRAELVITDAAAGDAAEDDTAGDDAPTPAVTISNPIPFRVDVAELRADLLIVDDVVLNALGRVEATPDPVSFTLEPGTADQPSTVAVELAPSQSDLPPLYGGIGVAFIGAEVDIDPDEVLARAHELGTSADLSTSVEVRSFQLEHPDVLPDTHDDVFGVEVQLKRDQSEPITAFLTRDQPTTTVQVSFTLADVLAGARPEQPKFSWRRRNMSSGGAGDFSAWEEIIGRQLFVAPEGL